MAEPESMNDLLGDLDVDESPHVPVQTLLGKPPTNVPVTVAPEPEASIDDPEPEAPIYEATPEERNPVPGAPVLKGLIPGDVTYPYDKVILDMTREAGLLEEQAKELRKTSSRVASFKGAVFVPPTLAQMNKKQRDVNRRIAEERRDIREKASAIMETVLAGAAPKPQ